MFNLLSSTYFVDKLEPFIKWGSIAIVGALFILSVVFLFINKEFGLKFCKNALIGLVLYALLVGITMLLFEIIKHYDPAYLTDNWVSKDIVPFVFIPILSTLVFLLVGGVVIFILTKKRPEKVKITTIVLSAIFSAFVIACIVLIAIFYAKNIADDGYYSNSLDNLALYLCAGGLVLAIILGATLLGKKDRSGFDTKCLAFAGVCIALSFALSYVRLFKMPQGGSITLASMLPLMIFAFIYGPKKGVLVGFIYGLLQAVQDPFIVHPAQFLLDYPVAFALLGFTGALKNLNVLNNLPQVKFIISAIIGCSLRFVAHVLSGVFAFGAYALDLGITNFWAYSTAYNSFVFIDAILVIVLGVILFSSKAFNREMQKLSPLS